MAFYSKVGVITKGKEVRNVLSVSSLAGGSKSSLNDCLLLDLKEISTLAISVKATHGSTATQPVIVHLLSSFDGSTFDSEDYATFEAHLVAGSESQKTVIVNPDVRYLKVQLENPTGQPTATNLNVSATLGFKE